MTDLPLSPEEAAWADGYDAGRASIMTAWKFLPVGGVDQYGDIMIATSDQVDEPLMDILAYQIAEQITEIIKRGTP